MKKYPAVLALVILTSLGPLSRPSWGQDETVPPVENIKPGENIPPMDTIPPVENVRQDDLLEQMEQALFDDKRILEGYTEKYGAEPKEILLAMIKDDTLSPIKTAAATRVFKTNFCRQLFSREKTIVEKILLRRLNRSDSPYPQIEIRHTLCRMDRFKYFNAMVPALVLKLEHYNDTISEMAFESLNDILNEKNIRAREARVVFNALRKMLFLSKRRLAQVTEPDPKLKRKLLILRAAIKVLGTQELRRLPKEVINLL